MDNAIIFYDFEDAPSEYKELSNQGGDEDYIVYFPANARNTNRAYYRVYMLVDSTNHEIHKVSGGFIAIISH